MICLEKGSNYLLQYNAKNYAQMHYNFKVKAPFSKEMQRSVEEALKEWDKKE